MRQIVDFLATGFYAGKAPKAPGTFGTLVGIPFVWGFFYLGPKAYFSLTLLFFVLACAIADIAAKQRRAKDPQDIVIDEMAGFLFCFINVPVNWTTLVIGFVLFRVLDIYKPFPISWLDRKIKGGLGIVLDDVAAGVVVNVVLWVAFRF